MTSLETSTLRKVGPRRDGCRSGPDKVTYVAPEKGEKWAALFALLSAGLSHRALKVGQALIWHANAKSGRCDPSVARLAAETKLSTRSVQRAIGELEVAKVLRRARHSGGAFTNAYAFEWGGLRQKYQKWLSDHGLATATPDKTVTPPLTELSQTPDKTVTQIREEYKKGIGEGGRSPSAPSRKRADASRLNGFQGECRSKALPPLHFLAKRNGPPSATVAREKAHQRFDADARKHLSVEAYEDFVGRVDDETVKQAIAAEVKKRGAGLRLALRRLEENDTK